MLMLADLLQYGWYRDISAMPRSLVLVDPLSYTDLAFSHLAVAPEVPHPSVNA